jgi:hypothetical protein
VARPTAHRHSNRTGLDWAGALLTDESLWIRLPPDLADSIMRRIET